MHGFIRTPSGQYFYLEAFVLGNGLVPLQSIYGIIGGTDQGYIRLPDDPTGTHGGLCQLGVAQIPNFLGSVLV